MRTVLAAVVAGLLAAAVVAGGGARGATQGPTCSQDTSIDGDIGSFLRVPTCRPFFASADRYWPARFRLVSGSLPRGLSLWGDGEPAAQVDGRPTRAGSYRFTIAALDTAGGHTTGSYTVRIHPKLTLTGRSPQPRAVVGSAYSTRVSAGGGKPPYTYGAFAVSGVALDRTTGVIAGTVSAGGGLACPFRLTVRDATGATASAILRVPVYDPSGGRLAVLCPDITGPPLTWIQGFAPRRGPLPTAAATRPAYVKLAPVTITGTGLANVTRVSFAGARAVFEIDSDRRLTAFPPVGVRTGSITLMPADGRARNAGVYRVYFGG